MLSHFIHLLGDSPALHSLLGIIDFVPVTCKEALHCNKERVFFHPQDIRHGILIEGPVADPDKSSLSG